MQQTRDKEKAHKWQERVLKQIKWSSDRCTLDKLMDSVDWPKMIRPETGWYGNDESVTFCADQAFVGLGVRNFKRVMACDYHKSFDTSMVKLKEKAKPQYLVPLTTMSDDKQENRVPVRVLPIRKKNFVYPKMADLWDFKPRYARAQKTFTAGNTTVTQGYTFELKHQEYDCVICDIRSQHKTVSIPLTAKGNFIIVEDDTTFSLEEVCENYTLPQRVSFLEKPPGVTSADVLLIAETRYDVLIACTVSSLYSVGPDTEIKNESMTVMTKGLTRGDVIDTNFVYFPKPINEESATSALEFVTWLHNPMCDIIKSKASLFEIDRFKDINVAIDANSTSVERIQQSSAENIYDYIKLRDFIGVFKEQPVSQAPTRFTPGASGKNDTEAKRNSKADDQRQKGPTSKNVTPASVISDRRKSDSDTVKSLTRPMSRSDMSDRPLPPVPQDPYDDTLIPPSVSASTIGTKMVPGHQQIRGEQAGIRPSDPSQNKRGSSPKPLKQPTHDYRRHKVHSTDLTAQLGPKSTPLKVESATANRPTSSRWPPTPLKDDTEAKNPPASSRLSSPPPKDDSPTTNRPAASKWPPTPLKADSETKNPPASSRLSSPPPKDDSSTTNRPAASKWPPTPLKADSETKNIPPVLTRWPPNKTSTIPATVSTPVQKGSVCPTPEPNPQLQSGKMIKFPPPNGKLTPLSQLTIDELASLFTYFRLNDIAEKMKEYKVTGKFFEESLDAKDFAAEPFHATVFQQKQIGRIKNGDY